MDVKGGKDPDRRRWRRPDRRGRRGDYVWAFYTTAFYRIPNKAGRWALFRGVCEGGGIIFPGACRGRTRADFRGEPVLGW